MPDPDRTLDYDDSCQRCGDRYGGCPDCKGDDYDPTDADPGYSGMPWEHS